MVTEKKSYLVYNLGELHKKLKTQTHASFRSDKLSLIIFIFCAFSFLGQSSFIMASWKNLSLEIPLFYSRPWGEAMLASPATLWILPAICFSTIIANFSIARFLLKENFFLSRSLEVASFLVGLMTLYDTVRIISLVK